MSPTLLTIVAAAMSEIANHTGNEPRFSLETAAWWFDKSSVVLAISLFIGFVCTVIIIVMGIAKEHHWDLLREKAAVEIEKLRAANLALEAKIKPRRISGDDVAKMLPHLSSLAAALPDIPDKIKLPIGIVSRMGDPDSIDFADDFEKLFTDAGWKPVRIQLWTGVRKGVFFATRTGTPIPAEVEGALAAALDATNIKHQTITIAENEAANIPPGFHPNVLYLIIGARP